MVTDLYNNYCNYKIKTLYQYTLKLTQIIDIEHNELYGKKNKESFWQFVINDYMQRYYNNALFNKYMVYNFIENDTIKKLKIENEIMSIINYFINKNNALYLRDYEKEIILAGYILKSANQLDIATSPFYKNSNNYNTIIINIINKANKIEYINLIDDGKKETNYLIELVKTNVRKERKLFELLTNYNSFNKYLDIGKNKYISQYNYRIPNLKKYDEYAVNEVFEKDHMDDKLVFVSIEQIEATLIKKVSLRKKLAEIYIPLKNNFISKESNLKQLKEVLSSEQLTKHLKLLVNFNDYRVEYNEFFKKYRLNYYIYFGKTTELTDSMTVTDIQTKNYLISSTFNKKYRKEILEWKKNNANIVIEDFNGIINDALMIER